MIVLYKQVKTNIEFRSGQTFPLGLNVIMLLANANVEMFVVVELVYVNFCCAGGVSAIPSFSNYNIKLQYERITLKQLLVKFNFVVQSLRKKLAVSTNK